MSEDLSKRMKEIVLEEDKSGYVIDRVSNSVLEDADGEVKEKKEETVIKKVVPKKSKKVKEKNGDSGDEDGANIHHREKDGANIHHRERDRDENRRATVVSFETSDEEQGSEGKGKKKEGDKNAGVKACSSKDSQPDSQDVVETPRRTFASLLTPYKRLSLVADTADLKAKLAEAGSNLVVIDFFATWCGPCKMISPKVEELAKEFPDVVFMKVDIDECDDIATEYDVQSMPTFIFIKNGAKIDGFSGANYDKLKETVQKLK